MVHSALLNNRQIQEERERETTNQFYRIHSHQANASTAVRLPHQSMVILPPSALRNPHLYELSMYIYHQPPETTLVLNGASTEANQTPVVTAAAAVAAGVAAAAAGVAAATTGVIPTMPEPQPIGVSIDQIEQYSSLMQFVKDPKVPEQERERCTVCLMDFETNDTLRSLHCSHLFHTNCIDRWLVYNKKCPVCRVDMDKAAAAGAPIQQSTNANRPPPTISIGTSMFGL